MARGSQRTTSFVFFCVVTALAVYFMLNPFGKTIPFKANVWLKEAKHPKMAMYIVEEGMLKGMTLSQTVQLLGEPDEKSTGKTKETILSYKLKGRKNPSLVVELDSKLVFTRARIIEH